MVCLILAIISCSKNPELTKWTEIGFTPDNRVKVASRTDKNGFYADYEKISESELKAHIESVFKASGFQYVGDAFDGAAWGYGKGEEKYAVKIEQTGNVLHLSVFNEMGGDPLIHGVVFSKYAIGETITGDEAKEMLINEIEQSD